MALDQIEALADGGQHAERQHVDLEHAERVDVVLVPFEEGAIRHGAVVDRHGLVEALAREHEAAHVLGEVAREAKQRVGERDRLADGRVGGVEPRLAHVRLGELVVARAPHQAGQRRRHVLLQAQRLAHLAHGHARAVVDDGRADGGTLAAVAGIEVLDHLLAPLVLEIDVDVGRLAPVGRDEALEQQVDAGGIDAGDAEAVAHGAVGGRAAALAEDLLLAGVAHDVVDGEEIARVVEPGDEGQLLLQQRAHLLRHAIGVACGGAFPGQRLEVGLRGLARRHRLLGVFVAQLLQIEMEAAGDLERARDGLRILRKEPRHLGGRLQVPLGIGLEAEAGVGDRAFLADAGEHVGQRLADGMVVERIGGGDERGTCLGGKLGQFAQPAALVAAIGERGGKIGAAARGGGERAQPLGEGRGERARRDGDEDLPLGRREQLGEGEMALALEGAAVARPSAGGRAGRRRRGRSDSRPSRSHRWSRGARRRRGGSCAPWRPDVRARRRRAYCGRRCRWRPAPAPPPGRPSHGRAKPRAGTRNWWRPQARRRPLHLDLREVYTYYYTHE